MYRVDVPNTTSLSPGYVLGQPLGVGEVHGTLIPRTGKGVRSLQMSGSSSRCNWCHVLLMTFTNASPLMSRSYGFICPPLLQCDLSSQHPHRVSLVWGWTRQLSDCFGSRCYSNNISTCKRKEKKKKKQIKTTIHKIIDRFSHKSP